MVEMQTRFAPILWLSMAKAIESLELPSLLSV